MTIGIGSSTSNSNVAKARQALEKSFEKIASAQRINRSSDDAAGLAISEKLRAVERGLSQGQRNLSDGISLARTAESALSQQSELISRMRELTVQGGNGTLDNNAKAAIQREFDQLAEEVTRISNATEFGGKKLLNGDIEGANAITLRDGTGSGNVAQVSVQGSSAQDLGVDGLSATDPSTLDALDQALSSISASRGELGAVETRLQSGIANLQSAIQNTAEANSRIRDADIAKASSELTSNQLREQASIAAEVHRNISSSYVLDLLR